MTPRHRPVVAVVGGGIAGLAAAWELVTGGTTLPGSTAPGEHRRADAGGTADDPDSVIPEVHVFEADGRLGGKLLAAPLGDRTVDVAADAFLARRPEATDLCAELGISSALVPMGASGASIWARRRLRPMPSGLNLGVPTRWWPVARSGILTAGEALRMANDLLPLRRRAKAGSDHGGGDESVGGIVGSRLGRAIVERFTDPLIGGINAGDADALSAAATFSPLLVAARQGGSLMRALRSQPPAPSSAGSGRAGPASPIFWSLASSVAGLATELAAALERRGVVIHSHAQAVSLRRATPPEPGATGAPGRSAEGRRWVVGIAGGDRADGGTGARTEGRVAEVDAVILALPAPGAAGLLADEAPVAARRLSAIEYSSVAVLTLVYDADTVPTQLFGTGFLVPRTETVDGHRPLLTGVTYLSRKWPHLARDGDELVRASIGRSGDERPADMDDDELVSSVVAELRAILGTARPPSTALVTRWERAFPQYRVGHLALVAEIEHDLAGLGGIAVAGAAFGGVGIPACIGSGRLAGRRVLADLHRRRSHTGAVGEAMLHPDLAE